MGITRYWVGNEEDGYHYYSKEGKTPAHAVEETTEKGNTHKGYTSLEAFYADPAVSGRYDRSVTIETTKEQDKAMVEKANEVYDKSYNFFFENCADLVEKTAKAGGIDLSKGNVLGVDIPNKQLEAAEKIAAEQKNSTEQKSKK